MTRREDTLWSRTVKAKGSHTEASRLALCRAVSLGRVAAYFTLLAQAVYHSAQEARVQTCVDLARTRVSMFSPPVPVTQTVTNLYSFAKASKSVDSR